MIHALIAHFCKDETEGEYVVLIDPESMSGFVDGNCSDEEKMRDDIDDTHGSPGWKLVDVYRIEEFDGRTLRSLPVGYELHRSSSL